MVRTPVLLLILALGLALAEDSNDNGSNNGGYNFGSGNGGKNGNNNVGGNGNGNANGNVNAGDNNGNKNGNENNGGNNGVFNGNYNAGNANGNRNGNNNLGAGNGGGNGNSNTGNFNGAGNGNSNTGNNNGVNNGNFNFGSGNGRNNGNGNIGNNNGNGNGNNNGNAAKGQGDPIFTDFVGRNFEFLGEPGRFYNLLSEQHHSLSTLMKVGVMWDHNGTYMEGFGFQFRGHQVVTSISADDELLVHIDGQPMVVREDEVEVDHVIDAGHGHTLALNWQRSRPELGQAAELATDVLKLTVWLTEAGTKDEGGMLQPAYLNFDLTLLSNPAGDVMAGVVGETYERLLAGAAEVAAPTHALYLPDDSTFRGHALAEDYEQRGYFNAGHRFNLYGGAEIVRARHLLGAARRVVFPASAAGRGLVAGPAQPRKLPALRRLLRA